MELSDFQADQLKEIANIGTGNAATAISKMLGRKVAISVPEIFLDRIEKMPPFVGDSQKVMTAVLMQLTGDVSGIMTVFIKPQVLESLGHSVVLEMGNIMAGASFTAFDRLLGLKIFQSPSDVATDMLGSTLDAILAELGQESESILTLKVNVDLEGTQTLDGQVLFMFTPKASQTILEAANKKFPNK